MFAVAVSWWSRWFPANFSFSGLLGFSRGSPAGPGRRGHGLRGAPSALSGSSTACSGYGPSCFFIGLSAIPAWSPGLLLKSQPPFRLGKMATETTLNPKLNATQHEHEAKSDPPMPSTCESQTCDSPTSIAGLMDSLNPKEMQPQQP